MKDYLQKETGYEVELVKCTDDSVVASTLKSRKIEVAFTGPLAYGNAFASAGFGNPNARGSGEAFGTGVDESGNTTRFAYVIGTPEVAQALGITTPLQGKDGMVTLKNKLDGHNGEYSFTWADTASTYGYGIPRVSMGEAGIDLSKVMKKAGFTGGHDASAVGVSQKTVDMGTVSSVNYDKLVAGGEIDPSSVKILWASDPVQNPLVYYRSDLPQDVKDKVSKAVLGAPADVLRPTGISQYKPCDDSTYDSMPALSKTLESMLSGDY